MFDRYFFAWSFIPILLLLLTIWAVLKPVFSSTPAREPVRFYFKQFLFTGVLLVLSSIIVHSGVVSQIQPMVEFVFPEGMLEWFIYPLLLVVFASIIPSEKAPEDTRIGTRARKK